MVVAAPVGTLVLLLGILCLGEVLG